MSSKTCAVFLLALISFSIFSIGNNFDASAQEISLVSNVENKIGKSYSAIMFDTVSVSENEKKDVEKIISPTGKSYSVFLDNLMSKPRS